MAVIKPILHSRCGTPVTVASLLHDQAIYVWCNHCNDIVEDGELRQDGDLPVTAYSELSLVLVKTEHTN